MRLKGILEALGLIALVASAGIGLSVLSRTYELGPNFVPVLIFVGALVAGVVLLYRRHTAASNVSPKSTERASKLSLTQGVGLLIGVVGLFIGLGNVTGVMPTFSYAGSIVAAIGAVIYGLATSKQ